MKKYLIVFLSFVSYNFSISQNCSNLNIQLESEVALTCFVEATMTMLHDQLGRDYLYVANKEGGLKIYSISDLANPVLVKHILSSDLDSLDLMSISQSGNYIYLALGNSFDDNEESGMAIVDVSTPETAFVTDSYVMSGQFGGSGIIKSDGNYAYLAAMVHGIAVINVQNKSNIFLESQFIPDFTFPVGAVDSTKINARGMEIRNDTIFLCFDAGGFRIIDATNKQSLNEIGRYSNPVMNGLPRAYNNVAIDGNLAYIAVDYCGVEVIDFSNPQVPILHGWWNPYNCPNNNWFTAPVHANEIKIKPECNQLFLSTGKSDMMVLDISDPTQPDSCNFYGGVSNNIGTWGIDVYENKLFLSYICAFIPFSSNWTGFKAFTFQTCSNSISENSSKEQIDLILTEGEISFVNCDNYLIHNISLIDNTGKKCKIQVDRSKEMNLKLTYENLEKGIYFLSFTKGNESYIRKIFI